MVQLATVRAGISRRLLCNSTSSQLKTRVTHQSAAMHHKIVVFDSNYLPMPVFDIPSQHTADQVLESHYGPEEVRKRIHDATVIGITPYTPMRADMLAPEVTPNLKFISTVSSGTDHVDLEAAKKRGIQVSNAPGQMVETVAEHTIGSYFALRRRYATYKHLLTQTDQWTQPTNIFSFSMDHSGAPPKTCSEEIMGIIGYGTIGMKPAGSSNSNSQPIQAKPSRQWHMPWE
jgi:lactate dehydrogenase-like 2-hydroxyacid dehydrogenase